MAPDDMNAHNHKGLPLNPEISKPTTLLVIVLDGWGYSDIKDSYNAISQANTPTMDSLQQAAPDRWRLVHAHGPWVGLPSDADMGNSEVGHNALGAGMVIAQGAKLVDRALATGAVFQGDGWKYIEEAAKSGTLHLIGLLSDGGVHSRYDQLMALIAGAVQRGVKRIRLHCLSDGRDVEDFTAGFWIDRLQRDITGINTASGVDIKIASGGGRMRVTMDRYESDWDIVQRGWTAHVLGEAHNEFTDPVEAIQTLQNQGGVLVSDQHLDAWVIVDADGHPVGPLEDGDAVVTFNFRADRMLELAKALEYPDFQQFDRKRWPKVKFAGILQYDGELSLPSQFLVPPPEIQNVSEEYLVASGCRIFACSESQKIGHVTFFWNGNKSGRIDDKLQTFVEIPSDRNITFDKAPVMQAHKITETVKEAILSGKYDFVRCNFPNPDMVGHTGNLAATIEACTAVDSCIAQLLEAVDSVKGRWLVTADHGNAEVMVQRDKNGNPVINKTGSVVVLTSHTLNPVPCAIGGAGLPANVKFKKDVKEAGLANVTATFVNLLGYGAPEFYQPSLIETSG